LLFLKTSSARVALVLLALGCSTPPPCSDCGGVCVDLLSDSANCGTCGQACAAGQRCEQGRCAATCSGLMCGGTCVDANNDPNNCGACGAVCESQHAQAACVGGQCNHAACEAGWFDCDRDPRNGCETLGANCVTSVCPATIPGQSQNCSFRGISDDGTRVLFTSFDSLFPDDPPFTDDLFLFETQTGSLEWLTRPGDAGVLAQNITAAAISGDGTRVAFTVYGDLVAADDNNQPDLYLLDLTTGILTYAPKPRDAGDLSAPLEISISRTGRYLASYVQGGEVGAGMVWSDLATQASILVPVAIPGVALSGDGLTAAAIASPDGGIPLPWVLDTRDGGFRPFLAPDAGDFQPGEFSFNSMAFDYAGQNFAVAFGPNFGPNQIWVGNPLGRLPLGDAGTYFAAAATPSLSSDGRLIAVNEPIDVQAGQWQCSVIDRTTGEHLGLSLQPGFCLPQLSGDGRTLVITESNFGSIVLLRVNRP
jgi:hypothetical protein